MSQESAPLSAEFVQHTTRESADYVMVDSDDHEGTSWSAEQFGIGLAAGILFGGLVGLTVDTVAATNFLGVSVLFGLIFGVLLGLYVMETR
ncbi:hypothetical protein [Haloferax sp. DFSO52]|uniref:hypothetical protein n=1 Tax=Haloferax sp. DFSO52 TaxID=3388505 RepID=UPI003A85136D